MIGPVLTEIQVGRWALLADRWPLVLAASGDVISLPSFGKLVLTRVPRAEQITVLIIG